MHTKITDSSITLNMELQNIFKRNKMIKNTFLLLFISLVTNSFAQKKMIPISQSSITGITLPAGSKQDTRMLSVSGTKILLEIESKKANITLFSTEVLLLPPVSAGGFNADLMVKNLSGQGWPFRNGYYYSYSPPETFTAIKLPD